MNGAGWQTKGSRRLAVNKRPGNPGDEIRRELLLFEVRFHDPILACRQPMPDLRRSDDHCADAPEHCHALKVAAVEPPKIRRAGLSCLPVDQLDHRLDPAWITASIEPSLVSPLHSVSPEVALESVALSADTTFHCGELAACETCLCRNAPRVAWHLRRSRETTDDLPGTST